MSLDSSQPKPFAVWNPEAGLWVKGPPEEQLFALLDVFSETWPTSGSMRNGRCSVRPTSAPPTSAPASSSSPGLLPTPTTKEANGPGAPDGNRNDTLRATIARLPTPRARDSKGRGYEDGLPSVVRLLKTPTAQLAVNGGSQHPDKRKAGGHGPTLADEVEFLPSSVAMRAATPPRRRARPQGDLTLCSAVSSLPAAPKARTRPVKAAAKARPQPVAQEPAKARPVEEPPKARPVKAAPKARPRPAKATPPTGTSTRKRSGGGSTSVELPLPGQLTIEDV